MSRKALLLASLTEVAPIFLYTGSKVTMASVSTATYKTHKCTACATQVAFASSADGLSPFCPACGEVTEEMPSLPVVDFTAQENMLTSVGCPHCSSQNVIEDRTIPALAGNMNCAACGNGVTFKHSATADTEELEELPTIPVDSPIEDTIAEDEAKEIAAIKEKHAKRRSSVKAANAENPMDGSEGVGNVEDVNVSKDVEDPNAIDGLRVPVTQASMVKVAKNNKALADMSEDDVENVDAGDKDDSDGKVGEAQVDNVENTEFASEDAQEKVTKAKDALKIAQDKLNKALHEAGVTVVTAEEEIEEELGEDDFTELDMSDTADEDGETEVKMDEDGVEARLLAFVDGVHVMTLAKADAGDNADLMVKAAFHSALAREAGKNGFKALASYGFKPVVIKAPIAKIVAARVAKALATEKAEVTASLEDVKANFDQCAKIASVALTQNFYRSKVNPLQETLVASLVAMGFPQAKQVVNRAMLAAGPRFVTAMMELAEELMDKSVEHRNELSDNLTQMNPEASMSLEDDDVVEDDTTQEAVVARLQGSRFVTKQPQTASVKSTGTDASRLRALKQLN